MIDESALIQELAQFPFSNLMDINSLLNHPSERETYILPTDDAIIQQVNSQEQENLSSDEMDDSNKNQKISPSEALKLLDFINLSLLEQSSNQMEDLAKVQSLKETFTSAHRSSLAQTNLDEYFA
uniref:AlNc14C24G2446 protein n=1 Tax=Albugo laibachii Nc14 TaxID=890382 RepID=F0W6E7_9STRA|nr:AlNc14C24G2446 [Albugo laibachii Nc14]|eukprot:CCA16691.1 AlNc14C24G2446 [Albugo laibachii Nc14]